MSWIAVFVVAEVRDEQSVDLTACAYDGGSYVPATAYSVVNAGLRPSRPAIRHPIASTASGNRAPGKHLGLDRVRVGKVGTCTAG
jgi:hypothetical protein